MLCSSLELIPKGDSKELPLDSNEDTFTLFTSNNHVESSNNSATTDVAVNTGVADMMYEDVMISLDEVQINDAVDSSTDSSLLQLQPTSRASIISWLITDSLPTSPISLQLSYKNTVFELLVCRGYSDPAAHCIETPIVSSSPFTYTLRVNYDDLADLPNFTSQEAYMKKSQAVNACYYFALPFLHNYFNHFGSLNPNLQRTIAETALETAQSRSKPLAPIQCEGFPSSSAASTFSEPSWRDLPSNATPVNYKGKLLEKMGKSCKHTTEFLPHISNQFQCKLVVWIDEENMEFIGDVFSKKKQAEQHAFMLAYEHLNSDKHSSSVSSSALLIGRQSSASRNDGDADQHRRLSTQLETGDVSSALLYSPADLIAPSQATIIALNDGILLDRNVSYVNNVSSGGDIITSDDARDAEAIVKECIEWLIAETTHETAQSRSTPLAPIQCEGFPSSSAASTISEPSWRDLPSNATPVNYKGKLLERMGKSCKHTTEFLPHISNQFQCKLVVWIDEENMEFIGDVFSKKKQAEQHAFMLAYEHLNSDKHSSSVSSSALLIGRQSSASRNDGDADQHRRLSTQLETGDVSSALLYSPADLIAPSQATIIALNDGILLDRNVSYVNNLSLGGDIITSDDAGDAEAIVKECIEWLIAETTLETAQSRSTPLAPIQCEGFPSSSAASTFSEPSWRDLPSNSTPVNYKGKLLEKMGKSCKHTTEFLPHISNQFQCKLVVWIDEENREFIGDVFSKKKQAEQHAFMLAYEHLNSDKHSSSVISSALLIGRQSSASRNDGEADEHRRLSTQLETGDVSSALLYSPADLIAPSQATIIALNDGILLDRNVSYVNNVSSGGDIITSDDAGDADAIVKECIEWLIAETTLETAQSRSTPLAPIQCEGFPSSSAASTFSEPSWRDLPSNSTPVNYKGKLLEKMGKSCKHTTEFLPHISNQFQCKLVVWIDEENREFIGDVFSKKKQAEQHAFMLAYEHLNSDKHSSSVSSSALLIGRQSSASRNDGEADEHRRLSTQLETGDVSSALLYSPADLIAPSQATIIALNDGILLDRNVSYVNNVSSGGDIITSDDAGDADAIVKECIEWLIAETTLETAQSRSKPLAHIQCEGFPSSSAASTFSEPSWRDLPSNSTPVNYKGKLLEKMGKSCKHTTEFLPHISNQFQCKLVVWIDEENREFIGEVFSKKKQAEQHAFMLAYEHLNSDKHSSSVSSSALLIGRQSSASRNDGDADEHRRLSTQLETGDVSSFLLYSPADLIAPSQATIIALNDGILLDRNVSYVNNVSSGGDTITSDDAGDAEAIVKECIEWLIAETTLETAQSRSTPLAPIQCEGFPSSSATSTFSEPSWRDLPSNATTVNYKGKLLEKMGKSCKHTTEFLPHISNQFQCKLVVWIDEENREFIGDVFSKKKQAEQHAFMLAYEHVNKITNSSSISSSDKFGTETVGQAIDSELECLISENSNLSLLCSSCSIFLLPVSNCVFYCKNEAEIHFAVDHRIELPLSIKKVDAQGAKACVLYTFNCVNCDTKLGTCHREDSTDIDLNLHCFKRGVLKVSVEGRIPEIVEIPDEKWSKLLKVPPLNRASVFKRDTLSANGLSNRRIRENRIDHVSHLPFPASLGIEDILVSSSLQIKSPYDYQLKIIGFAMKSNCICVMPTGSGKTLPACLLMAKYIETNTTKLAIFVVDRIPLVEQQAQVYDRVTNSTSLRFYSETATRRAKREFLKRKSRAVFTTAGSLFDLLNNFYTWGVHVSDFSLMVFDECHHASKNHVYAEILDMVRDCDETKRPRLLGLSASPVKAESTGSAEDEVEKLKKKFMDASIIMPVKGVKYSEDTQWVIVDLSSKQIKMSERLTETLSVQAEELIRLLSADGKVCDITKKDGRNLLASFALKKRQLSIVSIVDCFEVNLMMGPGFIDDISLKISIQESPNTEFISSFLVALENTLRDHFNIPGTEHNQKKGQVIVFVETKVLAAYVLQRLSNLFSDLKPEKIIGHDICSSTGMSIKKQEEVISKFNSGECSILVATSVVEEGLDIANCDLVIRYGSHGSLIQFLQSRGRARSKTVKTKMKVIISRDEMEKAKIIDDQEATMITIVKKFDVYDKIDSLLNFDNSDECSEFMRNVEHLRKNKGIAKGDTKIVITLLTYCSEADTIPPLKLKQSVQRVICINEKGVFNDVVSFEELPKSELRRLGTSRFVSSSMHRMFTIQTSSAFDICTFFSRFDAWDFEIDVEKGLHCQGYIILSNALESPLFSSKEFYNFGGVLSINCGCLVKGKVFFAMNDSCKIFEDVKFEKVEVHHTPDKLMRIIGSYGPNSGEIHIEISLSDLAHCIFVTFSTQREEIDLYFCLSSVPSIFLKQEEISERLYAGDTQSSSRHFRKDIQALSDSSVLCIRISKESWSEVLPLLSDTRIFGLHSLLTKFGPALNSYTSVEGNNSRIYDVHELIKRNDTLYELYWNLQVIKSARQSIGNHQRLISLVQSDFIFALSAYAKDQSNEVFTDLLATFEQLFCDLKRASPWTDTEASYLRNRGNISKGDISFSSSSEELFKCYRLVITPTRIIFQFPYNIKSNRLVRKFGNSHRFVYCHFRGENKSKIYDKNVWDGRYKLLIKNGIDIQWNFSLKFLVASGSQIREQNSVFVVTEDIGTAEKLRNELIPGNDEVFKDNHAKRLSRLGLFCTADYDAGELPWTDIDYIDDILTDEKILLTDGAGLISRSKLYNIIAPKFDEIKKIFSNIETTSAIHIRYAGFKGVLTVLADEIFKEYSIDTTKVIFRKSMEKFKSTDCRFCIVRTADFFPLRLNRDVLNLLFAFSDEGKEGGAWDPYLEIKSMQDKELSKLVKPLHSPDSAAKAIRGIVDPNISDSLINAKISLNSEPFFRTLLGALYKDKSTNLRKKTHISVEKGALLIGVPDFTGKLGENEVYINIQGTILKQDVLIYRNPCLDPADLRICRAVNIEGMDVSDIIVFPAKQGIRISISAACSGGDLDGDLFAVIWDSNLIPPKVREFQALNYNEIVKTVENMAEGNTQEPLEESDFVICAMCNSQLGRIATYHLALCDILPRGAADPLSRQTAQQQAVAVDFPKTGIPPVIPKEVIERLKIGYPDFMEVNSKACYISNKPIGKLYRICVSTISDCSMQFINVSIDNRFIHPHFTNYLEEAKLVFADYVKCVKSLMIRFSLESEAQLIVGVMPSSENEDVLPRREVLEFSMKNDWATLREYFRDKFFQNCDDKLAKASAWYFVCYEAHAHTTILDEIYIGFPWIIGDVLVKVDEDRRRRPCSFPNELIQDMSKEWLGSSEILRVRLDQKLSVFSSIIKKIHLTSKNLSCFLYGSISHFLCDEASDYDIHLSTVPHTADSLRSVCLPLLGNISDTCEFRDGDFPVIHCTIDRNAVELGGYPFEPVIICDVSNGQDSLEKAEFIRRLYIQHPAFLPCLIKLMEWAKDCGLIRNKGTVNLVCPLRPGEFHALVLHTLEFEDTTVSLQQKQNLSFHVNAFSSEVINFFTRWPDKNCKEGDVVNMIFDLFQKGSQLEADRDLEYVWPTPHAPIHKISANAIGFFVLMCKKSMHCFSNVISWNSFLESMTTNNAVEILHVYKFPVSISRKIADCSLQYKHLFEALSGAQVEINFIDNFYCRLEATGTPQQIKKLKIEINQMVFFGKLQLTFNRWSYCNADPYHVPGNTLLSIRDIPFLNEDLRVACKIYSGSQRNVQHASSEMSELTFLKDSDLNKELWRQQFCEQFREKCINQLGKIFPKSTEVNQKHLSSVRFQVRFGKFYFLNAISQLKSRSLNIDFSELQQLLIQNYDRSSRRFDISNAAVDSLPTDYDVPASTEDGKVCRPENSSMNNKKQLELSLETNGTMKSSFWNGIVLTPDTIEWEFIVNHINGILSDFEKIRPEEAASILQKNMSSSAVTASRAWIVELLPSPSISVRVFLDDALNIIDINSREVAAVSATVINSEISKDSFPKMIYKEHDIRVKICYSPYTINEAYANLCTPDNLSPISFQEGYPIPAAHMKAGIVHFARNTLRRQYFVKNFEFNTGSATLVYSLVVTLTNGYHYHGSKLEHRVIFSELKIDLDNSIMRKFIIQEVAADTFLAWIDDVLKTIFDISELLRSE